MEQVVAMEGDYQAGELFTGDISQTMGIEEEVNDVSTSDKNATLRRSQTFNHCYKCGKTRHTSKRTVLEMVMRRMWSPSIRLLGQLPTPWRHKSP